MHSYLQLQKAFTSPAFHPKAQRNLFTWQVFWLAASSTSSRINLYSDISIENFPNSVWVRFTATGIAPDFHTDFPFNRNNNGLLLQTK